MLRGTASSEHKPQNGGNKHLFNVLQKVKNLYKTTDLPHIFQSSLLLDEGELLANLLFLYFLLPISSHQKQCRPSVAPPANIPPLRISCHLYSYLIVLHNGRSSYMYPGSSSKTEALRPLQLAPLLSVTLLNISAPFVLPSSIIKPGYLYG